MRFNCMLTLSALSSGCALLAGIDDITYHGHTSSPPLDSSPDGSRAIQPDGDALDSSSRLDAGTGEAGEDAGEDADGALVDALGDSGSSVDALDECTFVHDDGIGQSWTDCKPLGTRVFIEADQACQATIAAFGGTCSSISNEPVKGCAGASLARANLASSAYGWIYAGPGTGTVVSAPDGGSFMNCTTSTLSWN